MNEYESTIRDLQKSVEMMTAERDKWRDIADALYYCGHCEWCRNKWKEARGQS